MRGESRPPETSDEVLVWWRRSRNLPKLQAEFWFWWRARNLPKLRMKFWFWIGLVAAAGPIKLTRLCGPRPGRWGKTVKTNNQNPLYTRKMPFTVQFRMGADDWDEPLDYEDCDTVLDVIQQLLADWTSGDADMHGTFAFLAAHGMDFGITDDQVDEGTDGDLLDRAGEAVLALCADDEAVTREYLIAVGDRVQIVEVAGEDDSGEMMSEEDDCGEGGRGEGCMWGVLV